LHNEELKETYPILGELNKGMIVKTWEENYYLDGKKIIYPSTTAPGEYSYVTDGEKLTLIYEEYDEYESEAFETISTSYLEKVNDSVVANAKPYEDLISDLLKIFNELPGDLIEFLCQKFYIDINYALWLNTMERFCFTFLF